MTADVQFIHQLYENFNARRMEAILSMLADDVVWANGMDGGHHHGREAVREYWTRQWAMIDPHVEPIKVTPEDGAIAVEVHQTVRDLEGKLLLDERVEHVFRLQDGHVSRFDIRSPSQLSAVVHAS
jgi:ketosteroid isomerase-like protein